MASKNKYFSYLPESIKEEIINSDATTLIKKMNTPKIYSSSIQIEGELKSMDILLTFFERACKHGMELEAVAEINIEEAVKAAEQCDRTRKEIFNDRKIIKIYFCNSLYLLIFPSISKHFTL